MLSSSTLWVAQALLWNQWDDEPVVYNIISGNTHLITPAAAKVLRRLEQQPSTASQLAESIASEFNVDSDQEVVEYIERLISDLDELGLVKSLTRESL